MATMSLLLVSRVLLFLPIVIDEPQTLVFFRRYVLALMISSGFFLSALFLRWWLPTIQDVRPAFKLPDPAHVSISQESIVLAWDAEATVMFGYTAEEAIGRPLVELIVPEELKQAHIDGITRYLVRGAVEPLRASYNTQGRHKAGEVFDIKLVLSTTKTPESLTLHAAIFRRWLEWPPWEDTGGT
jgi:PAS domain S-box-containing protein